MAANITKKTGYLGQGLENLRLKISYFVIILTIIRLLTQNFDCLLLLIGFPPEHINIYVILLLHLKLHVFAKRTKM